MQVPIIYSTGPNGKHVFNSLYVSNYKRLDWSANEIDQ